MNKQAKNLRHISINKRAVKKTVNKPYNVDFHCGTEEFRFVFLHGIEGVKDPNFLDLGRSLFAASTVHYSKFRRKPKCKVREKFTFHMNAFTPFSQLNSNRFRTAGNIILTQTKVKNP